MRKIYPLWFVLILSPIDTYHQHTVKVLKFVNNSQTTNLGPFLQSFEIYLGWQASWDLWKTMKDIWIMYGATTKAMDCLPWAKEHLIFIIIKVCSQFSIQETTSEKGDHEQTTHLYWNTLSATKGRITSMAERTPSENVTSHFYNNSSIVPNHYACKMCSHYSGIQLVSAIWR